MGTTDKGIRISIAIVLAILSFTNVITGTLSLVALLVAAIFVLTSFISFCPLYTIFGIKTCKVEK